MPYVDKRTGNIVIRVVYDGAPKAGKTTNLVTLTERMPVKRRSGLVSPGAVSRRTEYFDWLTFQGGFVDGRRLQCQLVSVPGQPSLLRRRRYLIDTADAIVFVADSRPSHVSNGKYAFELMHKAVVRRGGAVPASLLLQANKQDLPESLTPEDLGSAMGIDAGVVLIAAQADIGLGVVETFVQAVRLGTQRVKEMILSGVPWNEDGDQEVSAEQLFEALERVEGQLDREELERSVASPTHRDAQGFVPRPSAYVPAALTTEGDTVRPPVPEVNPSAPRPALRVPRMPLAPGSGHVWPLAMGRRVFAEVAKGRPRMATSPRSWAPAQSEEVEISENGVLKWLLHTNPRWAFESPLAGRLELLEQVGRLVGLDSWRSPDRVLSLQVEDDITRLWMVTPALPALRETLERASQRRENDHSHLVRTIERALALFEQDLPDLRLPCDYLDAVGVSAGGVVVLALPDRPDREPPERSLRQELFALLARIDGLGLPARERSWLLSPVADRELAIRLDDWMARDEPRVESAPTEAD